MGRGSTRPAVDWIFGVDSNSLAFAALSVRLDPNNSSNHAFVEPLIRLTMDQYNAALAATQQAWRRAWFPDLA